MRRTLKCFMMAFATTCLTACLGQDDFMQGNTQEAYGSMELSFEGKSATRSTTTTISSGEAKNFLVTVSQGGEVVRGPQTLGTMNMRFPVGQDYTVYAESCTEADAESNNNFWGQKRFVGTSAPFSVKKGETTPVRVGMSVDNSAMCVVIQPSLANYFKNSCTISLSEADRGLVWNYDNAGRVEDDETIDGQIAYFNIGEAGTRTINYTINAVADDKTITKEGTITLTRAKMSRLNLAYESGFFTLTLNVSEEDIYVGSQLTVGPDNVIQDDGTTETTGSNDEFIEDGTEVDYNQYN